MQLTFNPKKVGLLLTTLAALFTACKKEKTTDGPLTPPVQTKLKKITQGENVLEFVYGNSGLQAIKTNDDQVSGGQLATFNIGYTPDYSKITELKTAGSQRIVPNYGNYGELASTNIYDQNNNLVLSTRYVYSGTAVGSIICGTTGYDLFKTTFEYGSDENVHKATNWVFNPNSGHLEISGYTMYEYDGKMNPMHIHKHLLYLLLQNTPRYNVTKETDYDENDQVTEIREYTYQYNNHNLPQSATLKTTVPGQGSTTSNITYSYQ